MARQTKSRWCALLLAATLLATGTVMVEQPLASARNNKNREERQRNKERRQEQQQQQQSQPYDDGGGNQSQNQSQYPPPNNQSMGDPSNDFNLNVRKDVIDDGVNGQGLMSSTARQNFSGGTNQQPLMGVVDGQTLYGGTESNGLKMQTGTYETRKPLNASATTFAPLVGGISQVDIQRLVQHDVSLIIDRSASMTNVDCQAPAGYRGGMFGNMLSRWDWCREQTRGLAGVTSSFNQGIKLMMFSRGYEVFPDVRINQVPALFQRYQPNPDVGTDMLEPIQATLDDYFKRKRAARGEVKPLAIAIIFDGHARKKSWPVLEDTIVNATRMMRDPDEIKITIFIVGNRGPRVLQTTFDLQNIRGARYQIVKVVPFDQVQRQGLARSLAVTLNPDR